jgi:hypothetical protein
MNFTTLPVSLPLLQHAMKTTYAAFYTTCHFKWPHPHHLAQTLMFTKVLGDSNGGLVGLAWRVSIVTKLPADMSTAGPSITL